MNLQETETSTRRSRLAKRTHKLRRTVFIIPSLFTVGNIFAGFYSIISAYHGEYNRAALAIGFAVVLDGLDGRIARMTGATSDFGLQLDSLADIISFGVAPSVLIYSWGFEDLGNFARFSAFLFLICGAMRLARFNVQTAEMKHFAGMPIPAGAGMIAAIVHFFGDPPESIVAKSLLVGLTYVLALLMISTIRFFSFKQLHLSKGKSHLNVLALAIIIAGVVFYSEIVLLIIAAVYALSGLAGRIFQEIRRALGRGTVKADEQS